MGHRVFPILAEGFIVSIPKHLRGKATAHYLGNIYEFIGQIGYGRVMTGRQINYAKSGFLSVDDWFDSLDAAGQKRIIDFLQHRSH